ncbi:hypothetical protein KY285_015947 [Solanum tuberosum]|nr:hypothetical protein KY285_015947 [Solanum tuberosum]
MKSKTLSCKSRFDTEKIKSLEEKIRVAASYAEDVVEMKISRIIKVLGWTFGILQHLDLLKVVEKMDTTKKQVMDILSHDADQVLELSGDSLIGTFSTSDPILSDQSEDDIVHGLDDDLEIIINRLKGRPRDLDIVTISGMGGIGKTTLARKAYDHLTIRYHFDILAWVTISQEFRCRNVLLEALHCISKQTDMVNTKDYDEMDDNKLADLVQKKLKGPRYLVVVDDIWSTNVWDSIRGIFPNYKNGSRILLTTRENEVAMYANTCNPHEINLLSLGNGWRLLCDKVFGPKHDHPPELEEIGKEIVGKYKCLGVLGLSYHHLPNRLKPCFLSMAGFREDFEVETWILIQLWIAEGFIRTSGSGKSLEEVAIDYLEDLISRNLIQARKRRFNSEIKTCGIHDLLREFCLIEAEMTKHMHVERTYPTLPTQKHNVRRFSFQTKYYSVDDCFNLLPPVARSIYLSSQLDLPFEPRIRLLRRLPISIPYSVNLPGKIWMMKNLRLTKLEAFKFEGSPYLPDPIKRFVFPTSLKRLSLSRCKRFLWEDISSTLKMLPNLEELKLKHYHAMGGVWRLSDEEEFKSLKLLLLTGPSLKRLEASSDNFPNLKRLVLKDCCYLQEIPADFGEICFNLLCIAYGVQESLVSHLNLFSSVQLYTNAYDKMDDNELADLVQKTLKRSRYLVVVDDIWSIDVWDGISRIFPNNNNGSRILLTTRETEVAMYANTCSPHEMSLWGIENGWRLLCDKVFGPKHDPPPELDKIGKEIVEKCQGLPLTISVIAGHLSKMARTLEGWKDVARNLSEIIASQPNKCLGMLGLSYYHLPNRLKPCFLSMGDFPEDFQVDTSRLIQLWIAEDFIRTSENGKNLEQVGIDYLEELISRNLIQARKRRFNGEIKACGIHDLLH